MRARAEPDFRTLFESAPALHLVVELDAPRYTIVAASDAYLRATVKKREEILGRGLFEAFPDNPADPQATRVTDTTASLERVVRSGAADAMAVQRHDVPRPEEEGGAFEERFWKPLSSPVFGREGELIFIRHSMEDVTEYVRLGQASRDALASKESGFRELFESAHDGIFFADSDGRYTDVNAAGCLLLGYSREELVGRAIVELVSPDELARHAALEQRPLEGGMEVSEWRLRRKDGTYVPVELSSNALPNGHLIVSLRDISEEKRAEDGERLLAEIGKILVAAGTDYQRLLTDVASVIVRNNADWCSVNIVQGGDVRRLRIVHSDPAMAATCHELERYPVRRDGPVPLRGVLETQGSVLIRDVPPEYLESLAQSAEHLRLLRSLDPGSLIVVPLVARGHTLGTLGLGASRASRRFGPQDVHLVERLATRVALAVDNARLHEALERAVHARDEVLGIVAHDLRNPLNAIVLQSQTLRRHGAEPERRDQAAPARIYRAAMRMNQLIQDLLDVTRLEGGGCLSITQGVVPIAAVLAEAIEQQEPAIANSGRKLNIDVAAGLSQVWADRARLLQVFDNLLGNASKFSRGRITVGAIPKDGEMLFWVADDGAGLSAEVLPRLFDRFWQETTADRRGAGLGLSIVKGIVNAHGGRVWVESEVGVGTTFYFTLPVAPRTC